MLKHVHHEFPSDIFLTLAAIDAKIVIGKAEDSTTSEVTLEEFLETDMSRSVILSLKIAEQTDNVLVKITLKFYA